MNIDIDKIEKVCFCTHLFAFCKQSVKGSIMAIYRFYSNEGKFSSKTIEEVRDILNDGHFVFQNNIQYLNSCWKKYFFKCDEYIENKFNLMMKFGKYFHPSCLFTQVWNFSQTLLYYVIARIDLQELKDKIYLTECLDLIMDGILSFHADDVISRNNFCHADCEYFQFNEKEDLIKIQRLVNK